MIVICTRLQNRPPGCRHDPLADHSNFWIGAEEYAANGLLVLPEEQREVLHIVPNRRPP